MKISVSTIGLVILTLTLISCGRKNAESFLPKPTKSIIVAVDDKDQVTSVVTPEEIITLPNQGPTVIVVISPEEIVETIIEGDSQTGEIIPQTIVEVVVTGPIPVEVVPEYPTQVENTESTETEAIEGVVTEVEIIETDKLIEEVVSAINKKEKDKTKINNLKKIVMKRIESLEKRLKNFKENSNLSVLYRWKYELECLKVLLAQLNRI